MPAAGEAVLQDVDGRPILRFERVLNHPPERVWRALTESQELANWHPSPFEFEPTAGGKIEFGVGGQGPDMPDGEVTKYDPPRVLAHTWGDDVLRWQIEPHQAGSLLVLTHTFDDRFKAARDAAGWHVCLDALEATLKAEKPQGVPEGGRLPGGWRELNSEYQRRFGIPPEKATPPPVSD